MRATDRLLPAAALCVAGLIATACGEADASAGNQAADYLADQADLLADRIAEDRPCEAIEDGERLVARTWATVSNGELSTATAAQVEEVVTDIVDDLVCEGPEDPGADRDEGDGDAAQDPEPAETSDDTDGRDDTGDGRDDAAEPEARDEPEGGDGASDSTEDRDSPSTSGRGTDPPGRGEGRGRDDAPGQERGGPPAGRGGGR